MQANVEALESEKGDEESKEDNEKTQVEISEGIARLVGSVVVISANFMLHSNGNHRHSISHCVKL